MGELFGLISHSIYGALALVGLFGVYLWLYMAGRIQQKKFRNAAQAEAFLDEVTELLKNQDYTGIQELCDTPKYWSKAVPQLIIIALNHIDRPVSKLRKMLAERFEREIIADFEHSISWVNTVVKTGPMLGLLGTTSGMVESFGKLSSTSGSGGDPTNLASEIGLGVLATAIGLMIAIPMTLISNYMSVQLGKFQDSASDQLSVFLDELELSRMDEKS